MTRSSERGNAPRSRLASMERTRRRVIALGIAALVVLALSPLFSHHVLPIGETVGASRSHLVALCVVALRALITPLHDVFHVLFWGGLLYAIWDRVRAGRLARRGLSLFSVTETRAGDPLWLAAEEAGIDPARVRSAAGLPGAALTIGWWKPSVYVACETIERLDHAQLVAVLTHEGAHVRRRDPLRLSLLRFLSCMLFWLPALRELADDLADEVEIIADDAAAARQPLVLASALVEVAKFARHPLPESAVGFHARPLFERRVRRLIGEEPAPHSHLTRRSTIGAAFVLFLVMGSGTVMAHASSGPTSYHADHCDGHDVPAARHLFCLFDQRDQAAEDCLHQAHQQST